jgi:hypothetical protein
LINNLLKNLLGPFIAPPGGIDGPGSSVLIDELKKAFLKGVLGGY